MKNPKLKLRKKVKIPQIRKFKKGTDEMLEVWWLDVKPYLRNDFINFLKKQGIIYHAKKQKKNTTKNKKKR